MTTYNTIAEVYVEDDGLSLRATPSINGNLLEKIPARITVTIIDGPINADGYTWWQVQLPSPISVEGNVIGWSVEGADGLQTLIPRQQIVKSDAPDCRPIDIPLDLSVDDFPIVYREDGMIVFLDAEQQNEYRLQLPLSGDAGGPGVLFWSADGRVAISITSPDIQNLTAFVTVNLDAGTYCKFQFRGGWLPKNDFSWSPNTHEVVFSLPDAFYIFNADINSFQQLDVPEGSRTPSWSPTGDMIAFGQYENEYSMVGHSSDGIYTIRPDGTDLQHYFPNVEVFTNYNMALGWSPDERMIAGLSLLETDSPTRATLTIFSLADESYQTIYTHTPPKNQSHLSGSVDDIVWTSDSKQLFISSPDGLIFRDLSDDENEVLIDGEQRTVFSCLLARDDTLLYSLKGMGNDDRQTFIVELNTHVIEETTLNSCWKSRR